MAYTTVNDPSAYFHTALYTGNGSSQTVTNDANAGDFKPDWIWVKNRSTADSHMLSDSNRGSTKALVSSGNGAEFTPTNGNLAFLTDGFSFGSNNNYNRNTDSFIAWQWKANGGTTASNSNGSITSTVQANTTAGFSIVTWTGTGSNGTVGHGLGKAPDCIFFKNYAASENWTTYHSVLGNSGGMYLNLSNDFNTASSWYSDTSPTSSSFYVGTNSKTNGGTMVAYCFANTKGFSKFGKYTGNGSDSNGAFVYTGFKVKYLLIKRTNADQSWHISDTDMDPINPNTQRLLADSNGAEETRSTTDSIDFLSNGFKLYSNQNIINGNGDTYVYMAFAQNPLVASNNVIALAR